MAQANQSVETWDRGPMHGTDIHIMAPSDQPFAYELIAKVPALHPQAEQRAQLIAAAPRMRHELDALATAAEYFATGGTPESQSLHAAILRAREVLNGGRRVG